MLDWQEVKKKEKKKVTQARSAHKNSISEVIWEGKRNKDEEDEVLRKVKYLVEEENRNIDEIGLYHVK